MHPVVQESFKTRLHIMSRKDMYIYDQKDWEKQQMKMMEEGFYDLSIKQHVEKGKKTVRCLYLYMLILAQ